MKKNIIIFRFLLIISFVFSSQIGVAEVSDSFDVLLEKAEQFYSEKEIPKAIVFLSKAILKDSSNPKLLDIIKKLSCDNKLPDDDQKALLQIEDLLSFSNNLIKRKSYFERKKEELNEDLLIKGFKSALIYEELVNAETKVWEQQLFSHTSWSDKDLKTQAPLKVVIKILLSQQKEISSQIMVLTQQHNRLKDLNRESQRMIIDRNDIRELIAQKQNDLYKQQIALIREKTDYFEQKTKSAQDKVEQLTQQIVEAALKLSEKDEEFNRQAQQLAKLNEHIQELESRFELRERILAEKDTSFESLKANLKEIKQNALLQKEEINKILLTKNEQLVELDGILGIYKDKLGDASREIKQKTTNILILEDQLAYVQKQLSEKDRIIKKAQAQIKEMKEQLKKVQSQFSCQGS